MAEIHKSAFVSVVGRPSAGKSTLMNALCGAKVAIVSPVPQTTRNTIRGILTKPGFQLVFMDTPGLHNSEKAINKRLRNLAVRSLGDSDLIIYVIDTTRPPGAEEEIIAALIAPFLAKTLVAVNKIDARESNITGTRSFLGQKLSGIRAFDISAEKGTGLEALVAELALSAPPGPEYYPEEYYTDQEPVFRIAEMVREKVFLHTRDEVPHAVYVDYSGHHMLDDGTLVYEGDLVVERDTQKGIIIGKGGAMIRQIREEAEHDLCEIFPYPVKLSLKVRVDPNWKKDEELLKKLIQ